MKETKNNAEEAWDAPEVEQKMTVDEAKNKGEAMMNHFVDLYALIDWDGDDSLYADDPWVKITFHKSGKFFLEPYRDGGVADEFDLSVGDVESE